MSARKNIPLSDNKKDMDELWGMWEQFKTDRTEDLQINVTSTMALKELLNSYNESRKTSSDTVQSEGGNKDDHPEMMEINVDAANEEVSLKDCVDEPFFLATFKKVDDLCTVIHHHASICVGKPQLSKSTNKTFTHCEMLMTCHSCGINVLWQSSPFVGTHCLSDHRMQVGIHLAGITPAKVELLLMSLGMERFQKSAQTSSNGILSKVVENLVEKSCNNALSLEDETSTSQAFDARYQQRTDAKNTSNIFISSKTHLVCVLTNISKSDDRYNC